MATPNRKLSDLNDKELVKLSREINVPLRLLRPPRDHLNLVFGIPRMRPVLDTLNSLRKSLPSSSDISTSTVGNDG